MQLNIKTDYALKTILYLADTKEIVNTTEISKAMKIPPTYVSKVMKGLISSGIIASVEGKNGRYYLAKLPTEISLLEVFLSSEPTMKISRCLEKEHYCDRQLSGKCPVRKYYVELQDEIREKLSKKTIDEFL